MSSTAVVVLSFEIQFLAGPTTVLVKRDSSTRKVSCWAAGCTWQFCQTRQLLFGGDRSRHCEESEVVVGCSFVQYWSPRRFECRERMKLVRTIHVAYILDRCLQLPLAHPHRILGGQCGLKKTRRPSTNVSTAWTISTCMYGDWWAGLDDCDCVLRRLPSISNGSHHTCASASYCSEDTVSIVNWIIQVLFTLSASSAHDIQHADHWIWYRF